MIMVSFSITLYLFLNFLILKQQLGWPARKLQEVFTFLALRLKEYGNCFSHRWESKLRSSDLNGKHSTE